MDPYLAWVCVALASAAGQTPPPASGSSTPEEDSSDEAKEPEGGVGVTPIELIPRVELRQSFQKLPGGVSVHDSTAEIDIQFFKKSLLRYQMPFRRLATPQGQISGSGDVQLELIAILASGQSYVAGLIAGAILDTASAPTLGAGKQQVVFGAAAALKPRQWWLGYAVVQEQISVGGDSARPDVNQLVGRLGNILFGHQYNWFKLDLDAVVDFEDSSGAFLGTLEAGSLLIGRVGLFLRAGTQLLGTRQLDYQLAGGIRYLFRLDQGRPTPKP